MTQTGLGIRVLALALCLAPAGAAVAADDCWEAGDAEQKTSAKAPPSQTQSSPSQNVSGASAANPPAIPQYQPLTVGGKFKLGVRRGFGPGAVVSSFAVAGFQQAFNYDRGYGQGAEGYFSRVGSNYGTAVTRHMVGTFMLASIFRQDPRYFRSGHKSRGKRLGYALSRVLVARGDNGRNQFNISRVGGALAGGLISRTWHEPPDDKLGRGLKSAAITLGWDAARNILREFWPGLVRKFGL